MVSPIDNLPFTFVPSIHNLLRGEGCFVDKLRQDNLKVVVALFEDGIDQGSPTPSCWSHRFNLVWRG